jgi:hypothetical protein
MAHKDYAYLRDIPIMGQMRQYLAVNIFTALL